MVWSICSVFFCRLSCCSRISVYTFFAIGVLHLSGFKLASNAEARKYRADPASLAREVRVPMENLEKKPEIKHRRNASTASRVSLNSSNCRIKV